jgi:hypothetical protein
MLSGSPVGTQFRFEHRERVAGDGRELRQFEDLRCLAAYNRFDERRRGRAAQCRHQGVEVERGGRSLRVVAGLTGRLGAGGQRNTVGRRQQFLVRLFEGQSAGRPRFGADLSRQLLDDLLELGIVTGERQRPLEILERRRGVAFAVEDLGEAAHGGQILRGLAGDELELDPRVGELSEVEQRPPERHPCRQIAGMPGEALAADPHGLLGLPGTPVFLGQLRKGNRRRVGLDPASQVIDAGMRHGLP